MSASPSFICGSSNPDVRPTADKLTETQARVLRILVQSFEQDGWPVTLTALGALCGFASKSSIHTHLGALSGLGYVQRGPNRNAGYRPTQRGLHALGWRGRVT